MLSAVSFEALDFNVYSAAFGCILAAIIWYLRPRTPKLDYPVVGDPKATDCRDALREGAKLYPNSPWILPLQDPMVILPHWAINEIKSLPEHKVSLNKELYIRFLGKYTLLGQEDEEMVSVIKHDLVRGLPEIFNDVLTDEAMYGLRSTFGTSSEWTSFPVFEKVARVITMINGRTFVGLPLSREEEWINSTISFTTEGDIVAQSLRPYPALIRPFVAPFLSTVRSLLNHQALVSKRTQPYIDNYLKTLSHDVKDNLKSKGETSTKGRLMDWLLGKYNRRVSSTRIAKDYLLSSAASIPIPASLLTHVLFELASRPEYVEPLRTEVAKVMKERGKWSYSCLAGLDKMDSFIKECQRLNSHGLTMMTRRTTSRLTLSNGSSIPKDVSIGISNYSINHSAKYYPDPEEFKGFRFSDLRSAAPENSSKFQFIGTSLENLNWGYGTHACPGRSFAGAEIKLVLAYILSNYDVKLGEEGRPDNMIFGILVVPSPFGKLLLRARKPIPGLEI